MRRFLWCGVVLVWVACPTEPTSVPDASLAVPLDAGGAPAEAGVVDASAPSSTDAGLPVDASEPLPDARTPADAGEPPADPLDAILDAWFANYNEDQGLDYLEGLGFSFPEGDPDVTELPVHRHIRGATYGPYSRNLMDFWMPVADQPTPVAVFIHGGGFVGGERESIRENNHIRRLLEAGIAVASISYRWAYRNPSPALRAPIPNDRGETHDQNGTRIDYILRDCARSVQYLRHRAQDWNIDPERVGAWGGSAGAGCTMWTASVPDLAQPDHPDPVLRQSSRLRVAGHNYGQVTYAFDRWAELLGFSEQWLGDRLGGKQVAMTQMTAEDFVNTQAGRSLSHVLDYYEHLDPSDPPFITTNQTEDWSQQEMNQSWQILHHVRGHYALYDRCQDLGMECAIRTRTRNEGFESDLIAYLIQHLTD